MKTQTPPSEVNGKPHGWAKREPRQKRRNDSFSRPSTHIARSDKPDYYLQKLADEKEEKRIRDEKEKQRLEQNEKNEISAIFGVSPLKTEDEMNQHYVLAKKVYILSRLKNPNSYEEVLEEFAELKDFVTSYHGKSAKEIQVAYDQHNLEYEASINKQKHLINQLS